MTELPPQPKWWEQPFDYEAYAEEMRGRFLCGDEPSDEEWIEDEFEWDHSEDD